MKIKKLIEKLNNPTSVKTSIGLLYVHNRSVAEEFEKGEIEELSDFDFIRKCSVCFLSKDEFHSKSELKPLKVTEIDSLTKEDLDRVAKAYLKKCFLASGIGEEEKGDGAFSSTKAFKENILNLYQSRDDRSRLIKGIAHSEKVKAQAAQAAQESISRINEIGSSFNSISERLNTLQSSISDPEPLSQLRHYQMESYKIPKSRSDIAMEELVDLTSETVRHLQSSNSAQKDIVIKLNDLYVQQHNSAKSASRISKFNIISTFIIIALTSLGLYFSYQHPKQLSSEEVDSNLSSEGYETHELNYENDKPISTQKEYVVEM